MVKINDNYCKLSESYLFSEIAHRVAAFSEKNPDKKIIKMVSATLQGRFAPPLWRQ